MVGPDGGRAVVPGVHLITHGYTNCYVVEARTASRWSTRPSPSTWSVVRRCLADVGRSAADIKGLVITHGHFDHVGFASRLQRCYGVKVWAPAADVPILRTPTATARAAAAGLPAGAPAARCPCWARWSAPARCAFRV